MIYIEDSRFEKQLALLRLVCRLAGANILVAWACLEWNPKSLAGIPVNAEAHGLLPVTTYGNDHETGRSTRPVIFTARLENNLLRKKSKVIRCFDSIALYQPDVTDWFACSIYHEHICMVKDDSLFAEIRAYGFAADMNAPNGW